MRDGRDESRTVLPPLSLRDFRFFIMKGFASGLSALALLPRYAFGTMNAQIER